jgi:predicted NACHT family NTPase
LHCPWSASPYDQGRLGTRENLLSTLHNADRLLVLGEPGAGKTVALERLAWEHLRGAGTADPVLIPLFNYGGHRACRSGCAQN